MKSPLEPLEVVATNEVMAAVDDALDMTEAELREYRETRNPALIKCKSGREAVRFVVKKLPAAAMTMLKGMSPAPRHQLAFQYGCHEIRRPGKEPLAPAKKQLTPAMGGALSADDDWYSDVASEYGAETCEEVGRVAFEFARLPEAARGKGPFSY